MNPLKKREFDFCKTYDKTKINLKQKENIFQKGKGNLFLEVKIENKNDIKIYKMRMPSIEFIH